MDSILGIMVMPEADKNIFIDLGQVYALENITILSVYTYKISIYT